MERTQGKQMSREQIRGVLDRQSEFEYIGDVILRVSAYSDPGRISYMGCIQDDGRVLLNLDINHPEEFRDYDDLITYFEDNEINYEFISPSEDEMTDLEFKLHSMSRIYDIFGARMEAQE
jgi:hypothetical protein